MTRSERDSFRLFCEQATDAQLREIIERERAAAASGDRYRRACLGIALATRARRVRAVIREVLADHVRDE